MKATNIRLIHRGQFLCYYEIEYTDKNGNHKTYEMVSKSGSLHLNREVLTLDTIGKETKAVVILVFNKDHNKILLSKEFRMGVNQYVYSCPAGLIDPGETVEEAAIRELREETGLEVIRIIDKLKPTFTCAPVTDELTNLIIVEADGEITGSDSIYEEIHSNWYTKDEAINMLNNGEAVFAGRMQAIVYMWAKGI